MDGLIEAMALDRVPGLALAIVDEGVVTDATGFGVANVDTGEPVTADTTFRIGSITKTITAATVLRLVDMGHLDLDAELPGGVTLRMLLSHSAGLPNDVIVGSRDLPRLTFSPRRSASYSNPGYAVAALAAERATETPFATLARELVTEPLGMKHTTLDPREMPRAAGHVLVDGQIRVDPPFSAIPAYAAAGLGVSSARDLALFACAAMDDPRMRTLEAPHPHDANAGFGLGFEVYTARNGRETAVHSGNVGAYWGVLAMSKRSAVVVLTNRTPGYRLPSLPYRILDEMLGLPSPWPTDVRRPTWVTA